MESQVVIKEIPIKFKQQEKKDVRIQDTDGMFIQRFMKLISRVSGMKFIDKFVYQFDSVARLIVIIYYFVNQYHFKNDSDLLLSLFICIIIQTSAMAFQTITFSPVFTNNTLYNGLSLSRKQKFQVFLRIVLQDDFSYFFNQSKRFYKIIKNQCLQQIEKEDIKKQFNKITSWFFLRRLFSAIKIFILFDIIHSDGDDGLYKSLFGIILIWNLASFIYLNCNYYQICILHSKQTPFNILANIIELSLQFSQSILFYFYIIEIRSIIYVACILYFLSLINVKEQVLTTEMIDSRTISLIEQIFFGSKTSLLIPLIQKDIHTVEMAYFNKFNKVNVLLFYIYSLINLGFLFFANKKDFQDYDIIKVQIALLVLNSFIAIIKSFLYLIQRKQLIDQMVLLSKKSFSFLANRKNSMINFFEFPFQNLELSQDIIKNIAKLMNEKDTYTYIIFNEKLRLINQYGNFEIQILDQKCFQICQSIYSEVVKSNQILSLNIILSKDLREDKQINTKFEFQLLKNLINKQELISLNNKDEIVENLSQLQPYRKIKLITQQYSNERSACNIIAFNKLITPFMYNNPTSLLYDLFDE